LYAGQGTPATLTSHVNRVTVDRKCPAVVMCSRIPLNICFGQPKLRMWTFTHYPGRAD
jgi:hypothetical protein